MSEKMETDNVTADYSTLQIAIIGATGAVGREMLAALTHSPLFSQCSPQQLPRIRAFASARSQGQQLRVFDQTCEVETFDVAAAYWSDCDFALVSAGGEFSKQYLSQLATQGVIVIDNSSAWRLHPDVPLVVPEVNAHKLSSFAINKSAPLSAQGAIIANPNCSTIQLMVAIAPLEAAFGINTVIASTYQSVSGAGRTGIDELAQAMRELTTQQPAEVMSYESPRSTQELNQVFGAPIGANVIPVIGEIAGDGYSTEEHKMIQETRKILERQDLQVMATAVRVPVFVGHSIAVTLELNREVTLQQVNQVLARAAGVTLYQPENNDVPTPLTPRAVTASSSSFVSRLRLASAPNADGQRSSWIQLWNVANNLKKGAATNAVQILEQVLRN